MRRLTRLPVVIALCAMLAPLWAADDGTIRFFADTMSGNSGKSRETTVLEGNASVQVGSLSISGARIELSGKDFRYVKATGGVRGEDTDKGFSFSADEVDYDRDTEVATLRGNAMLDDTKNEVSAGAGLISYNRKTEVALLQVAVTLKRRKIDCTAGFALYRRAVSLLDLSGEPVVIRDTDEFQANRISVDLDTERITLDGAVSGTLKESEKEAQPEGEPSGKATQEGSNDEKSGQATPVEPPMPPGSIASGTAAPETAATGEESAP